MPNVMDPPWGPGSPKSNLHNKPERPSSPPSRHYLRTGIFHFLLLPREIRDTVYRHLLEDAADGIQPQYKGCMRGYVFLSWFLIILMPALLSYHSRLFERFSTPRKVLSLPLSFERTLTGLSSVGAANASTSISSSSATKSIKKLCSCCITRIFTVTIRALPASITNEVLGSRCRIKLLIVSKRFR